MTNLVWMRRDLRLYDHAALATALAEKGEIQPVFVFDKGILERFQAKNDRRLSFLAETLCAIDTELKKRGGHLLVFYGHSETLIPKLAKTLDAKAIFSAEDFEQATRARDAAVKKALPSTTRFVQMLDHLIRAPQKMLKQDGTPYKVFTPFYKLWRHGLGEGDWAEYTVKDQGRYASDQTRKAARDAGLEPLTLGHGPAHLLKEIGYYYAKDDIWTIDDVEERLERFIARRLKDYKDGRNILAHDGTSHLSPYLRHGLISVRHCLRAAHEAGGGEVWISELGWREFYACVLFHFPEVVTHEFMKKYRGTIPWHYGEKAKQAFFEGTTGYPVVDAAVRELTSTGYMHNRARMIVASFVTKDLLLDWRIGEEFFAQYLMDYELASNNGGWQWGASTGTDASPYFRVFNPVLQSKKFDPKGEYIRRHVPELKHMSDKEIHAPWLAKNPPANYPAPIVDHAQVKERVLAVFKKAGGESESV